MESAAVWPAMGVFVLSMTLLYLASTVYHSLTIRANILKIFQKLDHMMIYVLIAGTYTPICVLALPQTEGRRLLILVWSIAAAGMLTNAFWITCPKWFSSIIYIAMGWACLTVFPTLLQHLSKGAFGWLLAGGLLYTIGGIIYALKLKVFNSRHKNFGSHEVFHLFVMGGSFCHFIVMYSYIVWM